MGKIVKYIIENPSHENPNTTANEFIDGKSHLSSKLTWN